MSALPAVVAAGMYFLNGTSPIPPYMDEVFHIWQTQRYCNSQYSSYHPKISTPPGLYILTALIAGLTHLPCSTMVLRSINFVISLLNFVILRNMDHSPSPLLSTLSLWLIPPLYFFSFLFYTDQLSLLSVLLLLRFRRANPIFLLFLSFFSVCVRQTNISWVLYSFLLPYCRHVPTPRELLRDWPFIFCGAASVAFYVLNGWSLAIGDKSAHEPVLHVPQLFYFLAFIFLLNLHQTSGTSHGPRFSDVPLCIVIGLIIHFFTYEHIYLVSDHRHYVFYIWRHFLNKFPLQRYLCAPLYLWALRWFWRRFTFPWSGLFLFCTAMALVPNKLLELRYFIIPSVIITRELRRDEEFSQPYLLHVLFLVGINVVTLTVFVHFPFYSTAFESTQRFMW